MSADDEQTPTLPPPLLNEGGECFESLDEVASALDALPNEERVAYRDANADAIAQVAAARLLIIAGPGAGKSHLFIERIEHWLAQDAGESIYVATFVRKLINDLAADIEKRLTEEGRLLVHASTLHTLARSLLERAGGTAECPLQQHVRIIDSYWAPIVWEDVHAFHPTLAVGKYPHKQLEHQFHIEEPDASDDWKGLLETYQMLCQFYNAVGFALPHQACLPSGAGTAGAERAQALDH